MTKDSITITKKSLLISAVVIAVILFILAYYLFYLPSQTKENKVEDFKKAMYDSILCQYSCPIIEGQVLNNTQLAPDVICIQSCVDELRAKNINGSTISDAELLSDNFLQEATNSIDTCKLLHTNISDNNNIDFEAFFPCVKTNLEDLKNYYSYLN